jgi:hypothetical protein
MKSEGPGDWVQSYRFTDVSDALLVLALPRVNFASLLPTIRTLRIEPDTLTNV